MTMILRMMVIAIYLLLSGCDAGSASRATALDDDISLSDLRNVYQIISESDKNPEEQADKVFVEIKDNRYITYDDQMDDASSNNRNCYEISEVLIQDSGFSQFTIQQDPEIVVEAVRTETGFSLILLDDNNQRTEESIDLSVADPNMSFTKCQ